MHRLARALTFVVVCTLALFLFTRPALTQPASCFVSTSSGDIQGLDRGAACAFLGIPYAAAPTGTLRWKPPQPLLPWNIFNAVTPPSGCATTQLPAGTLAGSEDCLKLNIWASDPLPTGPVPVVVWLHTGGFFGASANFPSHNGERLALERGVIVVAPNYRLGPFGFLAHTALSAEDPTHPASGNYGLMDQRAALAWVRDNIEQFGGDPSNVTLAGTSAGGDSVGLHMVSPASAGLFQRAIIQSGAPTIRWPSRAEAESQGDAFASALGCTAPETVLTCVRSKTTAQVLLALPQAAQQVTEPAGKAYWLPAVDGIELPDQPRRLFEAAAFHHVPTILGTTRDEGWGSFITRSFPSGVDSSQYLGWVTTEFGADAQEILSIYPDANTPPAETMARVLGDTQFVCETRRLARLIERTKTPTFVYSYDYEIAALSTGHVIHGVESNILFGNNYVAPQFTPHLLDAPDLALHLEMSRYWTRFAATGNPNSDDPAVVHWPAYRHPTAEARGSDKFLVLDGVIREGMRPRETQCDALERFFFRSILAGVPAGAQ
jgi:para-nitrobenzyl esterase